MIKLVISDLDSTLLQSGMEVLEEHTLKVIEKLLEKNNYFVIASGRSYKELKKIFNRKAYAIFFVCENGALIIYHGTILNKNYIEKNKTISFVNEIEKKGYNCLISGVNTLYTTSKNHIYLDYLRKTKGCVVKIKDIKDLPEEALKISVFQKNHDISKESWIKEYLNYLYISYEGEDWIDFIKKGVNKGSALKIIKESFLEKYEKVLAFGDNYNDLEMLLMADYSYAMKNGSEKIIQICNKTTDNPIQTIEEYMNFS